MLQVEKENSHYTIIDPNEIADTLRDHADDNRRYEKG